MKKFILIVLAVAPIIISGCSSKEGQQKAIEAKQEVKTSIEKVKSSKPPTIKYREFVVIDELGSARVLGYPPDGRLIRRIPALTKTEILGKKECRTGIATQTWYKIKINGKTGWISQYVTTGDIIKEPVGGGSAVIERAPYADDPLGR